tara:strand:+ start:1335 stop:1631 length:297 start_codon:yes stop_codon:yes gene_type:complete
MAIYVVKDGLGNPVNTIVADESFMKKHYTNYDLYVEVAPDITPESMARLWRDRSLLESDEKMYVTDHSNYDAYKAWRKKLRDWPATDDFPEIKPELDL